MTSTSNFSITKPQLYFREKRRKPNKPFNSRLSIIGLENLLLDVTKDSNVVIVMSKVKKAEEEKKKKIYYEKKEKKAAEVKKK